jgi:AraC-like DNA-binding protein
LSWLAQNLHQQLTLEDIARRAATSVRSLNRHFKEQTGTTPLRWLLKARVRRAQVLLETTAHSVERMGRVATTTNIAGFWPRRDQRRAAGLRSGSALTRKDLRYSCGLVSATRRKCSRSAVADAKPTSAAHPSGPFSLTGGT